MSIVVVERTFPTLDACNEVAASAQAPASCAQRQRVTLSYQLCARDGRHMLGIYDAPDADAVRITQDDGGLPYERIWSARQLNENAAPLDPRYETVVVERELPMAIVPAQAEAFAREARDCHERNRSHLIASLLSLDGLRMVCIYRAPDAESVRNANAQSSAPFVRAWTA